MRALFLNENLGGHATVHLNLRQALNDHTDVDARFYDVPSPGLLRRLAAVPVPGLGRWDLDLQPLRYQLAQSAVARGWLRHHLQGADVVHAYTHNVALLSAGLLRNRPSVVSLDGTNTQNAYRLPYRAPTRWTATALRAVQPLERRVYDAATLVVTHSRWAAASVADYGVAPSKIRVIPFGVTVAPLTPRRQDHDRPRVVFVGRSMARKGGHRLLRLHQDHLARHCDLDLVTWDHVDPAPGVRVVGDVRPGDGRLASILAGGSVFAFPSEMDLSPNVVLEAMAAGLPVVALRVGAIGEMVDDGETGVLVDRDDDRALVAAIRSLVDDPAAAAQMGAAARQRVLDRFDARTTTSALLDVLRDACEQHAHPYPRRILT